MARSKTRLRLSPNFVIEEFDCRDGTRVPRKYIGALVFLCETILEPMRKKFGSCRVHSGFRTTAHNTAVGGARESFHMYHIHDTDDVAADVSFATGSVDDWHEEAERLRRTKLKGNGGIGYYPRGGFVHIDTRDTPANWDGP